jgi:hypothetical protein
MAMRNGNLPFARCCILRANSHPSISSLNVKSKITTSGNPSFTMRKAVGPSLATSTLCPYSRKSVAGIAALASRALQLRPRHSPMILNKTTTGFVVQKFYSESGRCLSREFIASDQVEWEDQRDDRFEVGMMAWTWKAFTSRST